MNVSARTDIEDGVSELMDVPILTSAMKVITIAILMRTA